jgi:ankyrin repeat protein
MLLDRNNDCDTNKQNKWGKTALHFAAKTGNAKIVKMLLQKSSSPNITDNNNWTALYHAAYNCHVQCVEILISYGANTNISINKDKRGNVIIPPMDILTYLISGKGARGKNYSEIIAILKNNKRNLKLLHKSFNPNCPIRR